MNGSNGSPDPCADPLAPQVIQLAIGDDWGLAFLYLDSTGVPIALGTDLVIGNLYAPFMSTPLVLDVASGRAQVIDTPTVSFALGLEKAVSETLQPDTVPPVSHLQIVRSTNGLQRTIGHFALQLLKGNTAPAPISQPVFIDPLSGERVILVGYSTQVPVPPGA